MQSLFTNTPMRILGGLTVFMVFLALASYASLNFERIKHLETIPATISVSGEGEVVAVPDTGQFTFSVQAEAETADAAQEQSGTAINEIIAYLTESGVAEADIKTTSYNLWPRYEWMRNQVCPAGAQFCPEGQRVQTGFEVNQTVEVKVRDIEAASRLLTGVGERGATNISSLNFVVDDTEALKAEARAAAIADAQAKAVELAEDLGVQLVRVAGYRENNNQHGHPQPFEARAMADEAGFGGPELPVGEQETTAQVTITYEIR